MWLLPFLALASAAAAPVSSAPLRPTQIECLGDKTIVGLSDDYHLIRYDGAQWHGTGLPETSTRLWRAPDGRIFMATWDLVVEVREPFQIGTRWHLQPTSLLRVAALHNALFAASTTSLYRLEPSGATTFEGVAPISPHAFRPHIPPVLLDSARGTIVCTASSATHSNPIRGHCLGPYGNRYTYR